jgi:hypothetical protein
MDGCHHHMKEVCQMQAWGSGAAMPPHPPPYMFLMKFSWCSIQQIQEEGTANIAYQIGRIHHWSNFRGGPAQSQYEQGYNTPDHQYRPPENKGRRRKRRK